MSDLVTRGRNALQRIHQRNEDARWTYGTVGRLVDDVPTFTVTGRANFIQVTIRQANGAQTSVSARNDAGVPRALGLPVRMYKQGTTYVVDGIAKRSDLAYISPGQDPNIHLHDNRYFTEAEHIAISTGAGDAGKPAKLGADGKWDASLIDAEDIADIVGAMVAGNTETDIAVTYQDADNTLDFAVSPTIVAERIHAATLDTTPLDADEVPSLDSSASFGLLRTTWTSIKAFFKTYFDTLYVDRSTAQSIAGAKEFTDDLTRREVGGAAQMFIISDGAQAAHNVTSYRASPTGGFMGGSSARGSEASPEVSQDGDRVFSFSAFGWSAAAAAFRAAAQINFLIDGTPDSGADTTDMPGRIQMQTTPEGSATPLTGVILDSAQNVAIANVVAPAGVRLFVLQAVLGSVVQQLETTATSDNVIQQISQGRIATTNATPTTLQTIAIPASHAYHLEVSVTARRTGGASGTAEDCAGYVLRGLYNQVAGAAALVGAVVQTVVGESQAAWDATLVLSGTNVLVQVTGATGNTITWHATTRHWFLSV